MVELNSFSGAETKLWFHDKAFNRSMVRPLDTVAHKKSAYTKSLKITILPGCHYNWKTNSREESFLHTYALLFHMAEKHQLQLYTSLFRNISAGL